VNLRTDPPAGCSRCSIALQSCYRLLSFLNLNKITTEEFNYNVAIHLIQPCGACTKNYLDSLPDTLAFQFDDHLRNLLGSEGTAPLVRPFVVNFHSDEEFHRKQVEIEPKIMQLVQAARARRTGR
jgi:hypothetical protein